jgi:hypothetical protein
MALTVDTLKHKQWFLRILIFSLVTAMIWVGVSLFRSQQKTAIPEDLLNLAKPLNPNIDTATLSRIEEKKSYSAEELQNFPVYRVIRLKNGEEKVVTQIPQEEPIPSPIPSPVPTIIPQESPAQETIPTTPAESPATSTEPAQ